MADATRRVSIRLSLDDGARVKTELRDIGETGQRSLDRIKDSAESASRGLDLLDAAMRSIQIVALAAGVRQLVQAGDALTTSLFRLQNATGSVAGAAEIYQQLYQASLQTGVAVTESADAFQRFSVAARAIGATNSEVARLVTGLQASAIVSGASAQEIGSATLQLAQALASGTLQGDELRSVLEAMPLLAEQLARELGVGVGELRKMGSEGQLTADRVFPALLRATEVLGRQLENAPLTVSRAFGQLQVSTQNFLGQLDQAIGLSNTLARALSGAARALDGVRRGAGLTTPGEDLARNRAALEALDARIAEAEAGNTRTPRRGSLGGHVNLDDMRAQRLQLMQEIDDAERAVAIRGFDERQQADQRAADARRQRAAAEIEELRPRLDARFRITQEFEQRTRQLNEGVASGAIDAAERQRLETLATRERDEALRRLEGSVRRVAAAQRDNRDAEREANEVLREREALIRENENATERYARRLSNLGTLVERAERVGQPVPDETISREAQAALEELERRGERVQQATERASETARELGLTFSSAFEDAVVRGERLSVVLRGIVQDISRLVIRRAVTEPLANLFGNLLGGSEGGFDFSKALENGFGLLGAGGGLRAANGAVLDPLGVVPFARGGVVERPTLFPFAGGTGLMGEAGPEAIMPLRRTRDGRLGVEAAGSAISVTVHINSPDAEGFRRSRAQISAALTDAVRRGARLR